MNIKIAESRLAQWFVSGDSKLEKGMSNGNKYKKTTY